MPDTVRTIAALRLSFTAACLARPRLAAAMIGERPDEMTPAGDSFAALTGTRAAVLAGLGLSSASLPAAQRRRILLTLAAVDGVDALASLVRARRTGRSAPIPIAVLPGVAAAAVQARLAY